MEKIKYNLFLDDIRSPEQCVGYTKKTIYTDLDWRVIRSYEQFVEMITVNGLPEVVSFDHDLADVHYNPATWKEDFVYQEKTGYDCVKWMVDYCINNNQKFPVWHLHTMNPHGRVNMETYILNYLKHFENDK